MFGSGTGKAGKAGSGGTAAPQPGRDKERSALVNEELLLLIFQLDLDTQLQRALNYEAYEAAQEIRDRRQKVDEALKEMKERKAENVGSEASSAAVNTLDLATEGLRLRAAMAQAVEKEDYKEAAALRDQLSRLEVESKRAQALASEFTGTSPGTAFRLGQWVVHRQLGYRGVVVGWDPQCCESEEWADASGYPPDQHSQPFYHLLVHQPDWEYDPYQAPVAYVPQSALWAPEQGGAPPPSAPSSAAGSDGTVPVDTPWVTAYGPAALQHPYTYILFLGQDGQGDFVPCRQLRDKYNVSRRDVYVPGDDGSSAGSGGDPPSKNGGGAGDEGASRN